MDIKSITKYLRISPKKMRLVTQTLKGMDAVAAVDYLKFVPKKASSFISKTINSGIANAEHNFNLKKENLFIKEIFVSQGPTLKRWRPRAFGRAAPIRKRSSHLVVILDERVPSSKIKIKKEKLKEPVVEPILKKGKTPPQSVEKTQDLSKQEQISETKEKEIIDTRRMGKRRTKQHIDKIRGKKVKGVLNRIFRRKSI